jgi:subfamily B ATP-binding cassette protein MsbA
MKKQPVWQHLVQFGRQFWWPERKRWSLVLALTGIGSLVQLPVPLITMYMIDRAVAQRNFHLLILLGCSIAGVVVLRSLCLYLGDSLALRLKEETTLRVQSALLRHVLRLPLVFFSDHHSGYLQSRIMNDARTLDAGLLRGLANVLIDATTVVIALSMILRLQFKLGLVVIACVAPFVVLRSLVHRHLIVRSALMQEMQSLTSLSIYESLAAIRTVKADTQETYQGEVSEGWLSKLRDAYINTNRLNVISNNATNFLTGLGMSLVIWYGCCLVIGGHATLGETIALASYLGLLYVPVNNLSSFHLSVSSSLAAVVRVHEYLGLETELTQGESLARMVRGIRFDHVSFQYENQTRALRDVSFTIPVHSITAIVGPTGAGKSTLVNLILRFYAPTQGRILIDNVDIQQVALEDLRTLIGVVDQHSYIFHGTIYDNLIYGSPAASRGDVTRASRMAYADEFIKALPEGYNTRVGERGTCLSTGERQRIALARIFLKMPSIVILDEAVSGVDADSERYIQQALRELSTSTTVVVIAHRLSSLMLAEHVVVLEDGSVVADGTHSRLLEVSNHYRTLFHEQFRPQQSNSDFDRKVEYV